jgi:hypothetical protein
MSMEKHVGLILARKTPVSSTRDLRKSCQWSHLIAKQKEVEKKIMNVALQNIIFMLERVLKHAIKSYDMGMTASLPLLMKACCGFLSPLKIHCPWSI